MAFNYFPNQAKKLSVKTVRLTFLYGDSFTCRDVPIKGVFTGIGKLAEAALQNTANDIAAAFKEENGRAMTEEDTVFLDMKNVKGKIIRHSSEGYGTDIEAWLDDMAVKAEIIEFEPQP